MFRLRMMVWWRNTSFMGKLEIKRLSGKSAKGVFGNWTRMVQVIHHIINL